MEATGVYHLSFALFLSQQSDIEIMIINPYIARSFANTMSRRSKNDVNDAQMLLSFLKIMPFESWNPPEKVLLELKSITRRTEQINKDILREKNRLHAIENSIYIHASVVLSCKESIKYFKNMIEILSQEAEKLVKNHSSSKMAQNIALLETIPGVGRCTAMILISELGVLPDSMNVRQWVAYVGLDPCERQSGTSIRGKTHISKRGNRFVRRILFLSAMSSSRFCEPISLFKTELENRGKSKMQALVAIMRKLLHCVFGMLKHQSVFDAQRFRGPHSQTLSVLP